MPIYKNKAIVSQPDNSYGVYLVLEYEFKTIHLEDYYFEKKTSYNKRRQFAKSSFNGNADFRKNSIYYGNFVIMTLLSIDKIIPITNNMGIVLGGGLLLKAGIDIVKIVQVFSAVGIGNSF